MSLPFAILRPVAEPWRPDVDPRDVIIGATKEQVRELINDLRGADVWALDVETRGKESWLPTTMIVGVGFAWRDDGMCARYFDRASMQPGAWEFLLTSVRELSAAPGRDIINHNIMFDAAMWAMELQRATGEYCPRALQYSACTYGLYKQLAGEGWFGQRWGLKELQLDLLLWESKGSDELEDWLVSNGHHKKCKLRDGESPEDHLARVRAWESTPNKHGKLRKCGVLRGEMWRAPAQILGKYCILDAISTLQFYTEVLRPALNRFPVLEEFHRGPWIDLLYLLIEQQHVGIRTDRDGLLRHAEELREAIARFEEMLRADSTVGPRVREIERQRYSTELFKLMEKTPEQWRRRRLSPPRGARITKRGEVSKAWRRYEAKLAEPPQETAAWKVWKQKIDAYGTEGLPKKRFSFSSSDDLLHLLFGMRKGEDVGGGLIRWTPGERPQHVPGKRPRRGTFFVYGRHGKVEVERTKKGRLAVGNDTMAQLPLGWGEDLSALRDAAKELSYVESYIEVLAQDAAGNWRIHPGWKAPGPVTGRLAGAEPNFQQIPKSLKLLSCFLPDDGMVWMEADWTAIEPHVLAELSRDAGLMQLYGPGAKPHDRYLFSVSQYPGAIGDAVRRLYPQENDPEFAAKVKAAKKAFDGFERPVGKKMVLSGDYGAGWRKQYRGLIAEGIRVTEAQVREMNDAHREFHRGVYLEFGPALEDEWRRRGGYVLNGLGFPICVAEEKKKDLINRVIQSTAHYIHVMKVSRLARALQGAGIPTLGIVWDFHDQDITQLPRECAERALQISRETVQWVNESIGTTVTLRAEPRIVANLADAKMEEKWAKHVKASK